MREEEKLAHDVYVTLSAQWGYPIFANIAAAEQTHSEAVLQLMAQYGLEDVAENNPTGIFENADLQDLYDQLVAQGSQSVATAVAVVTGATAMAVSAEKAGKQRPSARPTKRGVDNVSFVCSLIE